MKSELEAKVEIYRENYLAAHEENVKLKEEIRQVFYLFEAFVPRNVAIDDAKQLAMYRAYHRLKALLPEHSPTSLNP